MASYDRWVGSLAGLALGDALGSAVEARGRAPAAELAAALRAGGVPFRARPPHAAGQVTDDTQSAILLATSLVTCRPFDGHDFARRLASLLDSGRGVGFGPGTRAAVRRLGEGVPWDAAGEPAPYAGNGAAMRVAPAGLAAADAVAAAELAEAQARVTHLDPRACAMAAAIAVAVHRLAGGATPDAGPFCEELASHVRRLAPEAADVLRLLPTWCVLEPDAALADVGRRALDAATGDAAHGISSNAITSVAWALYAFLRTPDEPREVLATAIGAGGDTDSMAAIAGALAGARHGLGAWGGMPLDALHDHGEPVLPVLETLAAAAMAAPLSLSPRTT